MNEKVFDIRKAKRDDAHIIREMALQVFPITYRDILSPDQIDYMLDWMYSIENILRQMDDGHVYFLASNNDEYQGYASVEQHDNDTFHLQKLYVLPTAQGKHLGKILFEKAIEYVKAVHPAPCVLELNVNRRNKARSFYEHMGMKIVRQGDFHIGNGFFMNDYIMSIEC